MGRLKETSEALDTRELIENLSGQPNYYAGLAAKELSIRRIKELEEALRPFSIAAGRVPQDAEDREKVYLNTLTAGDYRKARKAFVGKETP